MKTESHSINDVLAKNATSFFIPPFQRAYAWGKPEIERYFSDILRIIDSDLDPNQHDKLEHFFGTIVIKEEKAGFANKSIVVDGQQRLTTTLLFLIALRDCESDETYQKHITQHYLKNDTSTFQDKVKLKQVTKDWEAYRALVNKTQANPGIINNAYQLLAKLINDRKRIEPQIQFEHYIEAIQKINVAVIFLDERPFKGEDPQIIFETLNSLGKPLTLSDLVRNFVLLNMNSSRQTEIYENTWHPKIESALGDKTSEFFRDYLQFKTCSPVKVVSDNNTKELYGLFKDFVAREFIERNDFIKDILQYVGWYKWIITEVVSSPISTDITKDRQIKELLRNIFHDIKSEAFKPFVLGLFEYHQLGRNGVKMRDDTLVSILTTIRAYLIRRRILRLTQGENKSIVLLSDRIEGLAKGDVSMLDLLSNMIYSLRLPNDTEIKNALLTMDFYEQMKKYSKLILGKIEEHNAKVAIDFRNPAVTIEHIMPQRLNDKWKDDLGSDFDNIHKTYLHNIGNLILTEFNSEIGNKSFAEKKDKLSTSTLNFRLDVIDKEVWDETNIKKHQSKMIGWLLETFPLPNEYKEESNWNTKILEKTTFSPLDTQAADIAEGNKPCEIKFHDNVMQVATWQDVFVNFLRYMKDNPNIDFEFIVDNQVELFNNKNTIVTWTILKPMIDENIHLTPRYKTLDGNTCDKVDTLTEDTLFIHVNISASTCMSRIAKVMNKFVIEENSIKIVLK